MTAAQSLGFRPGLLVEGEEPGGTAEEPGGEGGDPDEEPGGVPGGGTVEEQATQIDWIPSTDACW